MSQPGTPSTREQQQLAVIGKYTSQFGADAASELESHWLVLSYISAAEFMESPKTVENFVRFCKQHHKHPKTVQFTIIESYQRQVEDTEPDSDADADSQLDSSFLLGINKLFWLKIVQRTWKRVFRERQRVLNGRESIEAVARHTITGSWPSGLTELPELRGMLALSAVSSSSSL